MLDASETRVPFHVLALVVAGIALFFALVAAVLWYATSYSVTDFPSCERAGGSVQEIFPRRCVWRGTTYVEELSVSGDLGIDPIEDTVERTSIVLGERYVDCPDGGDRCLKVDGQVFTGEIEGYDYREGDIRRMIVQAVTRGNEDEPYRYVYESTVSSHYVFTPEPEPEVVEEEPAVVTPVRPTTQELYLSVGRYLLECDATDSGLCLVVDDQVFLYDIEGFVHQSGHSYELRVLETNQNTDGEVIEDGEFARYILLEVISEQGLPSQTVSTTTATTTTEENESAQ